MILQWCISAWLSWSDFLDRNPKISSYGVLKSLESGRAIRRLTQIYRRNDSFRMSLWSKYRTIIFSLNLLKRVLRICQIQMNQYRFDQWLKLSKNKEIQARDKKLFFERFLITLRHGHSWIPPRLNRSVTRDLPATDLEKWQKRKLWKISDKDLDDGETLKMGNPIYVKDIFHKYKLRQYLALKALFDNNGHSEDHHPLWFQNFPKKKTHWKNFKKVRF